jgi:hypothetical protein
MRCPGCGEQLAPTNTRYWGQFVELDRPTADGLAAPR